MIIRSLCSVAIMVLVRFIWYRHVGVVQHHPVAPGPPLKRTKKLHIGSRLWQLNGSNRGLSLVSHVELVILLTYYFWTWLTCYFQFLQFSVAVRLSLGKETTWSCSEKYHGLG